MQQITPGSALLCAECGHSVDMSRAKIDVIARKLRRTAGAVFEDDLKKFKCSKCNAREPLLVLPPDKSESGHSCTACGGDGGNNGGCYLCGGTGWIDDIVFGSATWVATPWTVPPSLLPFLQPLRAWAVSEESISRAYIFGSRCRGTHGAESDLDLAVDLVPSDRYETPMDYWFAVLPDLEKTLAPIIPWKLDVEVYASPELTPKMHRILNRGYIQIK
ncbi:nucleotidyltransferase domain-containing protein [Rudaea sp.]|uniref:nucleotidyltransferase family protein n=1 Tax=Rudaea sp. TaxID=2136325 RepID=UPI00321F99A9